LNIGIIGGGLMGLALAERLSGPGRRITVLERERQLGGLATWHDYGRFTWDRFYHVILPADGHLIGFLRDIGLEDQLRWARTRTGFYVDRGFHSMSSGLEFLRFRPLNLWGKARLAFAILYCARLKDWKRLERIPVGDWLRRLCGPRTYEKIWRPLLLAKLGESYERVSAVFIWSYIKRMFSARDSSTQREQLGYVSGGYRSVLERLEQRLLAAEGSIRTGVAVCRIAPASEGGVRVETDAGVERFDKVVFTGPVSALQAVADAALCRVEQPEGASVEYLGVICLVLVTRGPLVPYYVVNIADARVPFTGIIGMSNLVSTQETAGMHLTFLPKYVHSDDPLLRAPEAQLRQLFLEGLHVMFPDLNPDEIESIHVNRAVKVQPLQVLRYSRLVPSVDTPHPDFFVLNTSQFASSSLNNNEVIRLVDQFVAQRAGELVLPAGGGAQPFLSLSTGVLNESRTGLLRA
jgi:protoporphyrinogen oxidase